MIRKKLLILLLLIVISCNDATDIEVKEITTPITINPLVNFDAFVGELPEDERNCLLSKFSNKEEMINFVSENSLRIFRYKEFSKLRSVRIWIY